MGGEKDNIMDAGNIGQDRAIQDPEDALKKSEGVYEDVGLKVPVDQKLFIKQLPQGPSPQPFGNLSTPSSGSR
jgi:hypothetical protein